jgi:hypothetical protein
MLDRSGVVIGDWVEKAWPAPVMVYENFAEVDVGEGWRVGWRSQRGLATDRCLRLEKTGHSKCKQC